jgi:3-methyladenine DNA glycosylase AlkD
MAPSVAEILAYLQSNGNPRNVAGMARYGIVAKNVYGVPTPVITRLARSIGKDHALAQDLWKTGVYDARIVALFVEEPERVTEAQMERWVRAFDNWAICDGVCLHLFDKTPYAYRKARAWSARNEEFVRRAGFVLMAVLAVHDKDAPDETFRRFLGMVKAKARDERNFVKKAVNWALRQIGKRNLALHREAVQTANAISRLDSPSARWIARDALRELRSPATLERLRKKATRRSILTHKRNS